MTARDPTVIGNRSQVKLQFGEKIRKVKKITLYTPATTDDTDTISVNYARFGITTVLGVEGWIHTTTGSVIVPENPTTVLTGTTKMTLTVTGSTDNKERVYTLYYI